METWKIKSTPKTLLSDLIKQAEELPSMENYAFSIPAFGMFRMRKTTKISWQYNGNRITRANLQELLLTHSDDEINVILVQGDPSNPEVAKAVMESAPKKEKKKGKDEPPPEPEEGSFGKVTSTQLAKTYKKKQVKNALLSAATYKKKVIKKIVLAINFEGKSCTGYDLLDGIDIATGQTAEVEAIEKIFSNL